MKKKFAAIACSAAFLCGWSPIWEGGLNAPAEAASATPCADATLAGPWERILKGGTVAKAVWSFSDGGKIACKGKDCARAAGKPVGYELKRKKISLAFEKGRMSASSCQMKDGFLFMNGGAENGGFTFRRM